MDQPTLAIELDGHRIRVDLDCGDAGAAIELFDRIVAEARAAGVTVMVKSGRPQQGGEE